MFKKILCFIHTQIRFCLMGVSQDSITADCLLDSLQFIFAFLIAVSCKKNTQKWGIPAYNRHNLYKPNKAEWVAVFHYSFKVHIKDD